ncbi:MAG: hypothetical protein IJV28_07275 [Paludibacteraceae bacterium]|nr:hypothetical protein [Paludibacteraceae bacterium]
MKTGELLLRIYAILLLVCGITSCSTSNIDGLSVGKVSNSECLRTRATGDAQGVIDNPTLQLTKDGNTISGLLKNFEVNCAAQKDVLVDCRQEGNTLYIEAHENSQDGVRANCVCPVNVYFTLYNVEGDNFRVILNGAELGDISFAEHRVVEIDRRTLRQAFEGGFDFSEVQGETLITALEYHPEVNPYDKPRLELRYDSGLHHVSGIYWYYRMPCSYQAFDVIMDMETDGTLVFRLETDGKYSADCDSRSQIVFYMENAQKDSYRIKVNPHTVKVTGEDGQEHEQTVYDYEGELKKDEAVSIPLAEE